ncbi:MAG TPA: hypothetical protein VFL96_12675 [Acidobacteriaceae bacterium]|jgi:hypothetical protein|nr:hypothetical protein [Acidobacteriaceae bacterium]
MRSKIVSALALTSLAMGGLIVAGAGASFDGVYVGKRVLAKGPADSCPAEESVSVTIHGQVLTFTNSALKNYPMSFDPHPDGTFANTHVDIEGDIVDIRGRIEGGVLNADVINPPCEHHWRLEKK